LGFAVVDLLCQCAAGLLTDHGSKRLHGGWNRYEFSMLLGTVAVSWTGTVVWWKDRFQPRLLGLPRICRVQGEPNTPFWNRYWIKVSQVYHLSRKAVIATPNVCGAGKHLDFHLEFHW
jgi:hypothetical protein